MSDLHNAIMNIQATPGMLADEYVSAYKMGHKDARHAAAELAALATHAGAAAEPVAVVGSDFTIFWAGAGPISPLVERHGIKAGSKLYAAPPAALTSAPAEPCVHEWVSARNEVIASGEICAKLCGAIRPEQASAQTPQAAGAIDARGQESKAQAARIVELEAQLAPYLEAEAAAERFNAARERAEQIADVLFPKFDAVSARRDKSLLPLQWHEKSWWWNGVSIKWADSDGFDSNGGAVELSSYVGGGEVERIDIDLPKAWIDASEDQWRLLVDEHKTTMAAKREAVKVAREAAAAQREIEAAKATLRRLGVGDAS